MSYDDKDWELDSGFADDFEFVITNALFGVRDNYRDTTSGQHVPLLIWEGHSPECDMTEVLWPIGRGWEITERGRMVSGKTRFNKQSWFGRLIQRLIDPADPKSLVAEMKGKGMDLRQRGTPRDASIWVGLCFRLKREEVTFGSGFLDDKGNKSNHLMPAAYLGSKGTGAGSVPSASVGSAPAKETAVASPIELAQYGLGTVEAAKLKLSAKQTEDEGLWQATVLENPELVKNEELVGLILLSGPEGLWARLRA